MVRSPGAGLWPSGSLCVMRRPIARSRSRLSRVSGSPRLASDSGACRMRHAGAWEGSIQTTGAPASSATSTVCPVPPTSAVVAPSHTAISAIQCATERQGRHEIPPSRQGQFGRHQVGSIGEQGVQTRRAHQPARRLHPVVDHREFIPQRRLDRLLPACERGVRGAVTHHADSKRPTGAAGRARSSGVWAAGGSGVGPSACWGEAIMRCGRFDHSPAPLYRSAMISKAICA